MSNKNLYKLMKKIKAHRIFVLNEDGLGYKAWSIGFIYIDNLHKKGKFCLTTDEDNIYISVDKDGMLFTNDSMLVTFDQEEIVEVVQKNITDMYCENTTWKV